MTVPKVSVVLTTYNRAHVLAVTLDSILSQTLEDFDLIISDDASQDDTERVCRQYEARDRRVRYRRGLKNVGMPGNLNAGIAVSAGEYIANLHDGDLHDLGFWNGGRRHWTRHHKPPLCSMLIEPSIAPARRFAYTRSP